MSAFGGKADIPPPWTVEELEFWPSSVVVLSRNIGTSAMAARTVELDRNDLDKSIEVLSSAAQALRLTRFKSLSYRALMLSVDVATVTFVIIIIIAIIKVFFTQPPVDAPSPPSLVIQVLTAVFGVSIGVGIVSLVLNIPLFVRVFRERARLKKLGLSSLSRSLWIESRRSRWISRARSYLLIGVGMVLALFAAGLLIEPMTLSPPLGKFGSY